MAVEIYFEDSEILAKTSPYFGPRLIPDATGCCLQRVRPHQGSYSWTPVLLVRSLRVEAQAFFVQCQHVVDCLIRYLPWHSPSSRLGLWVRIWSMLAGNAHQSNDEVDPLKCGGILRDYGPSDTMAVSGK